MVGAVVMSGSHQDVRRIQWRPLGGKHRKRVLPRGRRVALVDGGGVIVHQRAGFPLVVLLVVIVGVGDAGADLTTDRRSRVCESVTARSGGQEGSMDVHTTTPDQVVRKLQEADGRLGSSFR